MAKHRGGKFYEFLCLLGRVPVRIDEIAEDLDVRKDKVHRYIRRAKVLRIEFECESVNNGLYSIHVTQETWENVGFAISACMAIPNRGGW